MKVEVCWKVNETGTGHAGIYVTARNGSKVLWRYELPGGSQTVMDLPDANRGHRPSKSKVGCKAQERHAGKVGP